MKKFENPELEVLKFDVVDVITTSSENGEGTVLPDQDFS